MKEKLVSLLDRAAWGLLTGFGVLGWLWSIVPCWDYPTHEQYAIMCLTMLPLCLVSLIYTLAVAPFCLAIAAALDHFAPEESAK